MPMPSAVLALFLLPAPLAKAVALVTLAVLLSGMLEPDARAEVAVAVALAPLPLPLPWPGVPEAKTGGTLVD